MLRDGGLSVVCENAELVKIVRISVDVRCLCILKLLIKVVFKNSTDYNASLFCERGEIGRRAGFRFQW